MRKSLVSEAAGRQQQNKLFHGSQRVNNYVAEVLKDGGHEVTDDSYEEDEDAEEKPDAADEEHIEGVEGL